MSVCREGDSPRLHAGKLNISLLREPTSARAVYGAGMTPPTPPTAPVEPATFGLLGPLLVTDVHGTAIHIPQTKQRIIMAALLLRANATVSGDQLAEALWQDKPPPNALAVIRTYVARLRRTLGQVAARLVSRPTGYAIEVR